METQPIKPAHRLEVFSGIACGLALIAPIAFYFLFYAPAIGRGVASDALPASGILWLKIHIAAYGIAYSLYFMGLLLAVICYLRNSTTRIPWIESATGIATILCVIGLITGVLYSKPAWNVWWVWDAKHVIVLMNTFVLLVITPFVVLIRLFLKLPNRNLILILILSVAVALCFVSWLSGTLRVVHPQWLPNLFSVDHEIAWNGLKTGVRATPAPLFSGTFWVLARISWRTDSLDENPRSALLSAQKTPGRERGIKFSSNEGQTVTLSARYFIDLHS